MSQARQCQENKTDSVLTLVIIYTSAGPTPLGQAIAEVCWNSFGCSRIQSTERRLRDRILTAYHIAQRHMRAKGMPFTLCIRRLTLLQSWSCCRLCVALAFKSSSRSKDMRQELPYRGQSQIRCRTHDTRLATADSALLQLMRTVDICRNAGSCAPSRQQRCGPRTALTSQVVRGPVCLESSLSYILSKQQLM